RSAKRAGREKALGSAADACVPALPSTPLLRRGLLTPPLRPSAGLPCLKRRPVVGSGARSGDRAPTGRTCHWAKSWGRSFRNHLQASCLTTPFFIKISSISH